MYPDYYPRVFHGSPSSHLSNYTIAWLIARTATLPATFITRYYHKDMTFQGGHTKYFAGVKTKHKDTNEDKRTNKHNVRFPGQRGCNYCKRYIIENRKKKHVERLIPDQFMVKSAQNQGRFILF